jgi:hypothetical protein
METQVEATSIKLAEFWTSCPAAWFIQVETQFKLKHITASQTKFDHIVSSLPQHVIVNILDILSDEHHQSDKYEVLKTALITRYSDSEQVKLDRVLFTSDIGDMKPSDFYRHLQTSASGLSCVGSDLLRKLWMNKLSSEVRVALVASGEDDIDQLLSIADQIYNITTTTAAAAVVSTTQQQSIDSRLDQLQQQVEAVHNQFSNYKLKFSPNSCKNDVKQQRTRTKSKFNESGPFCWYHFTFGNDAVKCKQPCSYNRYQKN